jgi:Tfp pilus assembly protein PilO
MTKKTKKITLIIFVLLVFCGVFYVSFFTSNETIKSKKEVISKAEQPITTLQEPWKKELEAIKELQKTQPKAAKNKLEKLLDQLPQKLQRYYKVGFQSGIDDIHFYGQLIDQHGEPVSGATVSVDVGGRYLSRGSGQGVLRSDSDGRFYVRGTGCNGLINL